MRYILSLMLVTVVCVQVYGEENSFEYETSYSLTSRRTDEVYSGRERVAGKGIGAKDAREFAPYAAERLTMRYVMDLERRAERGYSVVEPVIIVTPKPVPVYAPLPYTYYPRPYYYPYTYSYYP